MNPHQCHFIILNFQMKSREKQNKRIEGAGSCIIIHTRLLHQYKMLLDLSDAGCSLNFVRFLTRRQEGTHQSSSLKETDKRNQSLSAMQQNITWVVSRTLSLSHSTLKELRPVIHERWTLSRAPLEVFGFLFFGIGLHCPHSAL